MILDKRFATLFASQVDVPANVVGAANWLAKGTELTVWAGGVYTTVGGGNSADFGISFGGAVIATANINLNNGVTNQTFFFFALLNLRLSYVHVHRVL